MSRDPPEPVLPMSLHPPTHTHTCVRLSMVHDAQLLLVTFVGHGERELGEELGELVAHRLAILLDVCVDDRDVAETPRCNTQQQTLITFFFT